MTRIMKIIFSRLTKQEPGDVILHYALQYLGLGRRLKEA